MLPGSTREQANVALIVETSVVYGREILKGISNYLAVHERWSVFLDERELDAPPPEWLNDWQGQGIICRPTTPTLAQVLKDRQIPVVDLNDRYGDLGLPRIASDMIAIGQRGADHLLKRGFTQIAYCGFEEAAWSDERLSGVQCRIDPCSIFRSPWRGLREHAWQEERAVIADWLVSLPKPVGIVACNDVRGHQILDACRTLGIAVPEEVAVVGVDNAETFCSLCDPPLSSVVPDAERIGYAAAELLAQLMRGEKASTATTLFPPRGVATRESTDSEAIADPTVARAVRFIRENATHSIGVDDLVLRFGVSRSTLERRFRAALGRSPHDEIVRARLRRVKTMLAETSWSLSRIAEASGFDHPEYLMVQFKRETGQTPSEWRHGYRFDDA